MAKRCFICLLALMLLALPIGCKAGSQQTEETVAVTGDTAGKHVPQKGESLAEAMDNGHLKKIEQDPPVKVEICIDHGGAAETAELTDKDQIAEFVRYFSEVTIGEETDEVVTDNYNWFTLTFSDGEEVSFSLNLKNLEFNDKNNYRIFTLSDFDDLWKYMKSIMK